MFKCILCGGGGEPSLVQERIKGDAQGALRAVSCPTCNHVQLHPPRYSLDFYEKDGQVRNVVQDYGTPFENLMEHSRIEARRRADRLREDGHETSIQSVLDVGGGYGLFGSELCRRLPEARITVLEPSGERVRIGQAHLEKLGLPAPDFTVALLDEAFAQAHSEAFDLVTMWHVLEHVEDPLELLRLAGKVLRPGGRLCIEVPNLDDELIGLSSAFKDRSFIVEHLSYFTAGQLEGVVNRALPGWAVSVRGYQRYGIFNYFHWIRFNAPQGADPDLFAGEDRWWLEAHWRAKREELLTSDALYLVTSKA